MATNALRDEAAMRSNQIDELVGFLADREDLRRNDPQAGEQDNGSARTRRHLILLGDGLVTDPLSYYLDLVPTAGSLAVEATTMPGLGPVARTAAAFGWTAAPVAFAPEDGDGGVDVSSNEVTVGFTLRFRRPRSGAQQTVEEELRLVVQPSDWDVAAAATGGEVLSSGLEIAGWIERLPRRIEASFQLPDGAAAAGPFELRSRNEDHELRAPTVVPGAGSPDDVAEVRLRRAFQGDLDSEFEGGGNSGVEVVASIQIESTSSERTLGRLTSTIVPPAGAPPGEAASWRVSTGLHREDGSVVTSHGRPFAPPDAEHLSFERPLQLPPGTDSAIVLAENLVSGRWGYALVDFVDLEDLRAEAESRALVRAIDLRPEDPNDQRGRATFIAEVQEGFTDRVHRGRFLLQRSAGHRTQPGARTGPGSTSGGATASAGSRPWPSTPRTANSTATSCSSTSRPTRSGCASPNREGGPQAGPVDVAAEVKVPRGGQLAEMRFFVKDKLAATVREEPFRREVLVPVGDPETFLRVEAQLLDGRIAEDVIFLNRPGLSARIGVELVQLYVVATDRFGLPGTGPVCRGLLRLRGRPRPGTGIVPGRLRPPPDPGPGDRHLEQPVPAHARRQTRRDRVPRLTGGQPRPRLPGRLRHRTASGSRRHLQPQRGCAGASVRSGHGAAPLCGARFPWPWTSSRACGGARPWWSSTTGTTRTPTPPSGRAWNGPGAPAFPSTSC